MRALITGASSGIGRVLSKISPDAIVAKVCYYMQERKK